MYKPFLPILLFSWYSYIYTMTHYNRKRGGLPPQPKPDSLDRSLPFRNNEARLKLIYEGQQIFKERPK